MVYGLWEITEGNEPMPADVVNALEKIVSEASEWKRKMLGH